MREPVLRLLRCPRCQAERSLGLTAHASDEREVRDGDLTCARCNGEFEVADGIINLLHDPPEFVAREAAGLERFADVMRADGWDRERILALPDEDQGYWHAQRLAMNHLLGKEDFQSGQTLVDVGSNTCWASNIFARQGLDVIALDIATAEMQGLRTADYFLETGEVYFERLLSVMYDPALASESVDYVFCCEVLHHNDRANLRRTLRELYRVLRPGGKLFIVNEPMRFPLRPKLRHAEEVAEFEGNEHVHFFHRYYRAVRAAGFEVARPWPRAGPGPGRAVREIRRATRGAWPHVVAGDRPLALDCTMPTT